MDMSKASNEESAWGGAYFAQLNFVKSASMLGRRGINFLAHGSRTINLDLGCLLTDAVPCFTGGWHQGQAEERGATLVLPVWDYAKLDSTAVSESLLH